jgi:hypothetical protein
MHAGKLLAPLALALSTTTTSVDSFAPLLPDSHNSPTRTTVNSRISYTQKLYESSNLDFELILYRMLDPTQSQSQSQSLDDFKKAYVDRIINQITRDYVESPLETDEMFGKGIRDKVLCGYLEYRIEKGAADGAGTAAEEPVYL